MENNQALSTATDEANKKKFEETGTVHVLIGDYLFKLRSQPSYSTSDPDTCVVVVLTADQESGWKDVGAENSYDYALEAAKQYSAALTLLEQKKAVREFDQERAFKAAVKAFLEEKFNHEFLERIFKKGVLSALYWREPFHGQGGMLKDEVVRALKEGTAAALREVHKA